MANALLDLYRGATLGSGAAKRIGQQDASSQINTAVVTRRRLLTQAIARGQVQPAQLGQQDSALLGLTAPAIHINTPGGGGVLGGVGGFFKNLGGDVTNLGKEFVPGIVGAGKSIVHDVAAHPATLLGGPLAPLIAAPLDTKSKQGFYQKVAKPSAEGVATDFSNIGKAVTGDRAAAEALYKHPLNPLLDVSAAFSGGAGAAARGGAVLRASAESARLADIGKTLESLTSRTRGYGRSETARPGTSINKAVGEGGSELPRLYSARPLTKAFQVASDKYVQSDLPGAERIRDMQDVLASRSNQRHLYAQMLHTQSAAIRTGISPLARDFKGITPDESQALHLALRGVNTDSRLAALEDWWQKSLRGDNEPGQNVKDFPLVDARRVEHNMNLSPEVKALAKQPSAAMINAAEEWAAEVSRGHEVLDPKVGENHENVIHQAQRFLDEHADTLGLPAQEAHEGAIEPNYVPSMLDRTAYYDPGKIASAAGVKGRFIQPPAVDRLAVPSVTAKTMLADETPSFMHHATGEQFLSGVTRGDMRVFLDHVAERQRYVVDKAYRTSLLNQYAYKTHDGVPIAAYTMDDIPEGIDRSKVTIIHPTYPVRWYTAETNVLKKVKEGINHLRAQGIAPESEEGSRYLDQLEELDAKAFITQNWGALKQPGIIVDKDFAKHQYDMATVNDPFRTKAGRVYMGYINTWRKYTLALMPRWGINTAVGTFLQSVVHGSFDPRVIHVAHRLAGEARHGEEAGRGSFYHDEEGVARGLPPGVKLGHQQVAEIEGMGPKRLGPLEKRGFNFPVTAHQLAGHVQAVEDYFRTNMYVTQLRREQRQALGEIGETVATFYRKGMGVDAEVREALNSPKYLEHTLNDTNKFAYNYTHLGPAERRYVRAAVPFWGWYKFISQLMWRLPAEYPGRTRVMNFLSAVGLEQQNSLGPIPDWLRGSIILNLHGGHLNYLSGQGLNPFSSFANPLDTHGGVGALGSLGQLAPPIQAGLSAAGLDPLTGQGVALSPQDNVLTGIFGNTTNASGVEVAPGAVAAPWRFVSQLAGAFPQYQLTQKFGLSPAEGNPRGSVYPDSIPFIHFRPRYTHTTPALTGAPAAAVGETGLLPKGIDLAAYQQKVAANAANYRRNHERSVTKLLRKTKTR